jgi:hypothetical protein
LNSNARLKQGTNNVPYLIILTVVYPFAAFLLSLFNFGKKPNRVVIVLFLALYGLTFLPIVNSDGEKYEEIFSSYQSYNFSDYIRELEMISSSEVRNPDVYAPTLLYVTSRFTSDSRFFFLIAAIIYFVVFLKLMHTIWELVETRNKGVFLMFFIGCVFVLNISAGINGIRFPLAFMYFSWAALKYIITKERKYIFLSLIAGLIHFSFWFACVFLILFALTKHGQRMWIVYLSLIVSFFASTFFSQLLYENISFFGEALEVKYAGYTRQGYLILREEHKENWNWYVLYNMYATYYFLIVALVITRIKFFKIHTNPLLEALFAFVVLLFVQALLTGNVVDSISNRYVILFKLFGMIYFFYLGIYNHRNYVMRTVAVIYVPIAILAVLVSLRADSFTVSPFLFLGNIFSIVFAENDMSLADFF